MRAEEKGTTYSWVAKNVHEFSGCVENNMVLQRHSHCQVTLQTITTTIMLCPLAFKRMPRLGPRHNTLTPARAPRLH